MSKFWVGVAYAVAAVMIGGLGATWAISNSAPASPEFLRQLAGLGSVMLLAFVVVSTWMVERFPNPRDRELVGFCMGLGWIGLGAVFGSLLLAEHRDAGYANALDDVGTGLIGAAILLLAMIVISQPLMAADLRHKADSDD